MPITKYKGSKGNTHAMPRMRVGGAKPMTMRSSHMMKLTPKKR